MRNVSNGVTGPQWRCQPWREICELIVSFYNVWTTSLTLHIPRLKIIMSEKWSNKMRYSHTAHCLLLTYSHTVINCHLPTFPQSDCSPEIEFYFIRWILAPKIIFGLSILSRLACIRFWIGMKGNFRPHSASIGSDSLVGPWQWQWLYLCVSLCDFDMLAGACLVSDRNM